MKKESIISKQILKRIKKSFNSGYSKHKLKIESLKHENYFNYEIDEWGGDNFKVRGELKNYIIKTLLKIYNEWKLELEKLNQNYYLAIWIYESDLLKSEVVCGINEKINYYENEAFMVSNSNKVFNPIYFGKHSKSFQKLKWSKKFDLEWEYESMMNWGIEQYESEKAYYKHRRKYDKIINEKFHVIEKDDDKMYFFPIGDIWIGK